MTLTHNALIKITKVIMLTLVISLGLVMCALVADAYVTEPIGVQNPNGKDFVVGPGKVELTINPGETKTAEIRVSNRLGENRAFRIEVEDFTGSRNPEETVVLLGNERGPYTLKDYVFVPETTFSIDDGHRAIIPVTISIPTDAEPGSRFGSVLVSTVSDETSNGSSGTAVVSRIGTLFFVTVPGKAKHEGVLKEFVAKEGKYADKGPINFRLLYENTGSVHLNPYGEIRIRNMLGKEVGAVLLDPWFALPGSLRLREATWESPFLFGKYTATASVNRGYDNIVDSVEYSFWVLPWKILVLFFVAVTVLVLIIRFVLTRFEIKKK